MFINYFVSVSTLGKVSEKQSWQTNEHYENEGEQLQVVKVLSQLAYAKILFFFLAIMCLQKCCS